MALSNVGLMAWHIEKRMQSEHSVNNMSIQTVKANEKAGMVSTFSAEKNVSSRKHREKEWWFQSFSVFLLPKVMPASYWLQVHCFQKLFRLKESFANSIL